MKYSFSSMLGAVLLFSGVFAFSSCGNDESDPDSTVTIAMATVEKQPQYDAPYLVLDRQENGFLEIILFWKPVKVDLLIISV